MRTFIVAIALSFLCAASSFAENQTKIFYVKGKPNIMKEGQMTPIGITGFENPGRS